jgi:hypothetical protein
MRAGPSSASQRSSALVGAGAALIACETASQRGCVHTPRRGPDFCVEALREAMASWGAPAIVNTDQSTESVKNQPKSAQMRGMGPTGFR